MASELPIRASLGSSGFRRPDETQATPGPVPSGTIRLLPEKCAVVGVRTIQTDHAGQTVYHRAKRRVTDPAGDHDAGGIAHAFRWVNRYYNQVLFGLWL